MIEISRKEAERLKRDYALPEFHDMSGSDYLSFGFHLMLIKEDKDADEKKEEKEKLEKIEL